LASEATSVESKLKNVQRIIDSADKVARDVDSAIERLDASRSKRDAAFSDLRVKADRLDAELRAESERREATRTVFQEQDLRTKELTHDVARQSGELRLTSVALDAVKRANDSMGKLIENNERRTLTLDDNVRKLQVRVDRSQTAQTHSPRKSTHST